MMRINFLPDDLIRKYKVQLINKSLFVVFLASLLGFSSFYTMKYYEKDKLVNEITVLEEQLNQNIDKSNELLNQIQSNELYGTLNANGKLDIENLLDNTNKNKNFSYRFDDLLYYVINATPQKVLINNITVSAEKLEITAQSEDYESMEQMYSRLNNIGLTELENVQINPLEEGSNMNVKESISFSLVTIFSEQSSEKGTNKEEGKE